MAAMVAMAALAATCNGEVILLQQEESEEEIQKKVFDLIKQQQRDLESAAVQFQKLAVMCESKDEWREPPKKKFRGAKGYLNKQNLPFYMRF